jgi:hypothetical protein
MVVAGTLFLLGLLPAGYTVIHTGNLRGVSAGSPVAFGGWLRCSQNKHSIWHAIIKGQWSGGSADVTALVLHCFSFIARYLVA